MFHVKHNANPVTGHHNVSRETSAALDNILSSHREKLSQYVELLLWWNQKINLVSRGSKKQDVHEHIRHSLIPVALNVYSGEETILDTGTGGGLPGVPLAVALSGCRVILNDISGKKSMVLKQIIHQMGLANCEVRGGDLDKLIVNEPCILTSKHAFKLKDLFLKSQKVPWKKAVIYKGIDYRDELNANQKEGLEVSAYDLSSLQPVDFYRQKFILIITQD